MHELKFDELWCDVMALVLQNSGQGQHPTDIRDGLNFVLFIEFYFIAHDCEQ